MFSLNDMIKKKEKNKNELTFLNDFSIYKKDKKINIDESLEILLSVKKFDLIKNREIYIKKLNSKKEQLKQDLKHFNQYFNSYLNISFIAGKIT